MASTMVVGIAGVTGRFGRLLASSLLKNPDISLRGYSRDSAKVPSALSSSSRMQLFQGGAYDEDSIRTFVDGCDVVVCCYLGDPVLMVDGQKKLIDACEAAGVPRYVASDWSLDYTKLKLGELFPKDPMIHVRAYLAGMKTIKGIHVLIGGFMEPQFNPFFAVLDQATRTFRYWGDGTEMWEGTTYQNAADFTAVVIADRSAVGIQKYLGDRKTIKEIAETFEKVYNEKPKLESLGSMVDLKSKAEALRAEAPHEVMKYMPLYYTYYWLNGQTYVGPETDNAKYPNVKPVSWEAFMKACGSIEGLVKSYDSF